jgi:UDP-N-acetylmuramyl-tripeptide synthetase
MSALDILAQLREQGIYPAGMSVDSRHTQRGDLFAALVGQRDDGRRYAADAVAAGAVAVITQGEAIAGLGVPSLACPQLSAWLGALAAELYDHPGDDLWCCAVTGTNGKTSVTRWVAQALTALGRPTAVVGTLGCGFPDHLSYEQSGGLTTPDAVSLQKSLAQLRAAGAKGCAIEASSIGLVQGRLDGCHIRAGALTQLSRDHLDYHGDMAAYAQAKSLLFERTEIETVVLNLDDELGISLSQRLTGRKNRIGFSLGGHRVSAPEKDADELLVVKNLDALGSPVRFELDGIGFCAPLLGRFNVENLLAVIGLLRAAGFILADIAQVIPRVTPPPGRMSTVMVPEGIPDALPLVVVDYAHTPDALEKALAALRPVAQLRKGHLVCVFGCGGDRDRGKRPLMGRVAQQCADRIVLTSDNPRNEEPLAIMQAVCAGMTQAPYAMESDREVAIRMAISEASAADVILIAGKGHETDQDIGGQRIHFSDAQVALSALREHPCI